MQIPRVIKYQILDKIRTSNRVVIIYGLRQVGKTTLCKEIISELAFETLFINADEQRYVDILSNRDSKKFSAFEFKWNKRTVRAPKTWSEQYPHAQWSFIDQKNWLDFVL